MLSILHRLPEKGSFARVYTVYTLLCSFCLRHRYLQFCLLCVISHIPLCCVLAVSELEERVDASDSLTTQCSPRIESLWIFFQFMCGLLATAINVYCVDQLTSSPAQRRERRWQRWWWQLRRPASARDSGYSSCGNSPNPSSSAAGRASSEMTNMRPVSAASPSDRAGTPHDDETDTPPQLTPTSSAGTGTTPDEPLSPADGFSPHGRRPPPAPNEHPPTYQQATAMPLRSAQPTLITIPAASPRPPMIRRQAHTHLPTQRLLHHYHSPRRSTVHKLARCLLLAACTAPLIASCLFPKLLRDSAYTHACSSYDWEVFLTAPPPASQMLPSAEFIPLTTAPAHAFTMQMDHQNTTAYVQLLPPQQRLARITYDTDMHSYRAMFVGADFAVVGGYSGMRFLELGLRGERVGRDYFGFPRVVVEMVDRAVVAIVSKVKRGSCGEVKVCVRGVETTVAAVVVGTLLVEMVEAAEKCRLG